MTTPSPPKPYEVAQATSATPRAQAVRTPIVQSTNTNPNTSTISMPTTPHAASQSTSLVPSTADPHTLAHDFATFDPSTSATANANNTNATTAMSVMPTGPLPMPTPPFGMNAMSPYGASPLFNRPPIGPYNPMQNVIFGMSNGISSLGRVSQLLQLNFDALHMSFSSLLRLVEHFILLRTEMSAIVGTVSLYKLMSAIGVRLRAWIFGHNISDDEYKQIWEGKPHPDEHKNTGFSWLTLFIIVGVAGTIIKWIWRRIFPPAPPPPITADEFNRQNDPNAPQQPNGPLTPQQQQQAALMQQQQLAQQQQMGGMGGMYNPTASMYGGNTGMYGGGSNLYNNYGSSMYGNNGMYGMGMNSAYGGMGMGMNPMSGGYGYGNTGW